MGKNQAYKVKKFGNKAVRRDYSKVSAELPLPNLVELQTQSYDWFLNEGIPEVFNEIYPIKSYNENVTLRFIDYSFDEPEYDENECRNREATFAAPLRATMRIEVINKQTGEVIEKEEEVFLGDLPLMTKNGTFIINGAERVIVSQIVRSPGAYYKSELNERTGRETYMAELIPGRGTWLELNSDDRRAAQGRILNMKVDRKRTIASTILFKAFGMSLDLEEGEDALNVESFKAFLKDLNLPVIEDYDDEALGEREFLEHYALLYTSFFGNYEELVNTLKIDKVDTFEDSLRTMYENQRADEIPTTDGAVNLMHSKFLDHRRYDLNKAGRYKLHKKLDVYNRLRGTRVLEDIVDVNGELVFEKGSLIEHRDDVTKARDVLRQAGHLDIFPLKQIFSSPDIVTVTVDGTLHLEGRLLAADIVEDDLEYRKGDVLSSEDLETLKDREIPIYTGIIAKPVQINKDNVWRVLDYGQRLFTLGRIQKPNGDDLLNDKGRPVIERFLANTDAPKLNRASEELIVETIKEEGELSLWLIGAAVQTMTVEPEEREGEVVKIVGTDPLLEKKVVVASDLYATYSYFLNFIDGIGQADDIDQLGNRRVRTVGELIQNQFRIGLSRMERVVKERMSITSDSANLTPKKLTNIRPLTALVKEFFSSSQLSQFMDQTNPLAELTNKRRISALGPGGLTRDRAGFEVRDVHASHYGRICPIETPEGPNIGLISNLTSYGKVNEYGFIETPYRIMKDGIVSDDIIYLAADEEIEYIIAQANEVEGNKLANEQVVVRYQGENIMADRDEVELVDVSPQQIVSVATAAIPFLENDDASRALMGANMQRQGVPLLKPDSPYVGTGIEHRIAKDSGSAIIAEEDGIVEYVDAKKIVVQGEKKISYELQKFRRSNQGTCITQIPIVERGERVVQGDILADGPSMDRGELALGQNVTVAFMTWHGYNFEDAIIMSDRLVKDDVYTSIHIEEHSLEVRETKLGPEEITRDIPNVSEAACRHLDERGIVMVGAEVESGDILVGKVTPKGQSEISPEEKLLLAIFGEKSREVRDNSLKVPHGGNGIVQDVKIFRRSEGHDLPPGVNEVVKVYIVQKRKISEGDKMAGRHGNKGVISRILPEEDMPFMEDGTPVDVLLNPLGVPSRMNIGQVLELHLGLSAKNLGVLFATSVFDGVYT